MSLELAFILCFFLSAFLSVAEMAFVSVNQIKLRKIADAGSLAAKKILLLHEQPQDFLTLILIGNNMVNIAATSISTYWLQLHFGIENEWVVTAMMAPLLIIFGETVPKDYGRLRAQDFLLKYADGISLLLKVFRVPLRWILKGVNLLLGPLGPEKERNIFVSEKEFRLLIEEGAERGILGHQEKRLIDIILDFERTHIDSVMIPVGEVAKVDIAGSVGEIKEIARRTHSRMVLVYEEIPSLIVGMIYVFDLLFESREDLGLKNYLRSPIFLPQTTSIEKAFLTLQEKRQSFAVVTDSQGEVRGVVAIEKLFAL